jgi:hypothetical protein
MSGGVQTFVGSRASNQASGKINGADGMRTPILLLALFFFGASASADGVGEITARNNLWEYAEPHHVFVMHGYSVDFVSPRGGRVPFSLDVDQADPPGMVSYTIKYEGFRSKADQTLTPDQIKADDYAAAFIGGGAGSLFDVSNDQRLLAIIARIYERGGVVGAPAAWAM